MKAVVLAAGLGRRLGPLTRSIAKPMMPVANRPVMESIIRRLSEQGFHEIFSNLYHYSDGIRAYFGDGSKWDVSITWRIEHQLTGPAGGVAAFDDLLSNEEDILVISGDALHDIDLRELVSFHQQRNALLSVVMKQVPHLGRYGVGVVDSHDRIIKFIEKPSIDSPLVGLVSCGIYCVSQSLLARIPRGVLYDFGTDLIPELAARGEAVFGFETQSYWKDIGTLAEFRLANLDAIAGNVHMNLPGEKRSDGIFVEPGCRIATDVKMVPPILIGNNTIIENGIHLVGPLVIGPCAVVGKNSYISHSVILQGTRVLPGTFLVEGLIGSLEEQSSEEVK